MSATFAILSVFVKQTSPEGSENVRIKEEQQEREEEEKKVGKS